MSQYCVSRSRLDLRLDLRNHDVGYFCYYLFFFLRIIVLITRRMTASPTFLVKNDPAVMIVSFQRENFDEIINLLVSYQSLPFVQFANKNKIRLNKNKEAVV